MVSSDKKLMIGEMSYFLLLAGNALSQLRISRGISQYTSYELVSEITKTSFLKVKSMKYLKLGENTFRPVPVSLWLRLLIL